jgi:hypothetical protein
MSKDGDWILREDSETMAHVLAVLTRHQARYRFGAPLDPRWFAGGWSAHFEFQQADLRVRTDFVTRPPRLTPADLARLWKTQDAQPQDCPFLDAARLAELKKTNREKDYVVIGELARLMTDTRHQLRYSRSATDLIALANAHPDLAVEMAAERPVLTTVRHGREALETALDAERRQLIHRNEERLARYAQAAEAWADLWPSVEQQIAGRPLPEAHRMIVERATGVLPHVI